MEDSHRMVWVGKDHKAHPVPTPAMGRFSTTPGCSSTIQAQLKSWEIRGKSGVPKGTSQSPGLAQGEPNNTDVLRVYLDQQKG